MIELAVVMVRNNIVSSHAATFNRGRVVVRLSHVLDAD